MSTQIQATTSYQSAADVENLMFVTMRVNKQLFGVPVKYVRDVLREQKVIRIPLAPQEVAGSLNLRGRIVTVIDLRKRLHLEPKQDGASGMFVVVEQKNELYSLIVDSVGDVLTVPAAAIEKTPGNLGGAWKDVSSGIYKLEGELLVTIDIEALLLLKQPQQ